MLTLARKSAGGLVADGPAVAIIPLFTRAMAIVTVATVATEEKCGDGAQKGKRKERREELGQLLVPPKSHHDYDVNLAKRW